MRWMAGLACVLLTGGAAAQPFHDPIPREFQGTFAPTLKDCQDPDGVNSIVVAADGVHYYEGDDYLLLGVRFSGSSTKSERSIPLFNGRFTGRLETKLLGELNVRMEMETPNTLIRYRIGDDGEPETKPVDTWTRCPARAAVRGN